MKKINSLKKGLLLMLPLALSCSVMMAQSTAKKKHHNNPSGRQSDAVQLQAKYEANGLVYAGVKEVKPSAARPCVKADAPKHVNVKRSLFDRLSPNGQALIKSQPEKYTIID